MRTMGHADTRILARYQDVVSELRQDAAARMDKLLGGREAWMTRKGPIPSGEAMLDVAAIVERTMISPGDDLVGILVLAVARNRKGKRIARLVATPLNREEMLLDAMRHYLAGPDDLQTFRRE